MGATNNIKEIIQKYELKTRNCYACSRPFTEIDIQDDNWTLEYRTNHDTDWTDFSEGEGRGWISIEVALYHECCPENKEN